MFTWTCDCCYVQDWSSYDELMTTSRTDSLQRLQSVTELHEFLQFITDDGKSHINRLLVVVAVAVVTYMCVSSAITSKIICVHQFLQLSYHERATVN